MLYNYPLVCTFRINLNRMSRFLVGTFALAFVFSIEANGATSLDNPTPQSIPKETVAAILTQPLPRESYGVPSRTCLSREQIRRMEVIDESAVMFFWSKGSETVWLSVLERPCRGLKQGQMIQMTQKRKTCPGDRFAGLRTGFSSGPGIDGRTLIVGSQFVEPPAMPGGSPIRVSDVCKIGRIHKVRRENLDHLLYAIKAKTRTKTIVETIDNAKQARSR